MIKVAEKAPEFYGATAYHKNNFVKISLKDYQDKWLVLFFYPRDFTFVCPTEIREFAKLEKELAEKLKKYGMRAVGPNCMGVLNTDPEVRMNAQFAEDLPNPGKTAFVSQSGALGAAILSISKDFNIGLSQFVSIGNKADVDDFVAFC